MWTEQERNAARQQKKALQTDIDNINRAFLALCEAQTQKKFETLDQSERDRTAAEVRSNN